MKIKLSLIIGTIALFALFLAACGAGPTTVDNTVEENVVENTVTDEPVEEENPSVDAEDEPAWEGPEGALVSVPVEAAPELDGVEDDIWTAATPIEIQLSGGANMGSTTMSIRSVYTSDQVFFYVTWTDPTQSFFRSPWEKQEDGSWAKIKDPDDKGGDNNLYYEDKLSFIWTINNSITNFDTQGCFTACHAGENSDVKPYGNKYTSGEGQLGDIWHWKSVRNIGQLDDQYLDWTIYSEENPGAGRKSDPKDGGGYVDNQNEEKTAPMYMGPEGFAKDGSPGYILEGEALPFDDSLFVAGDIIPGIVKSAFTGDRGDLAAGWIYADGMWILEIGRALTTASEFDVQFNDLTAEYYFGAAVFDNAQVRHAFQAGANTFVFQP